MAALLVIAVGDLLLHVMNPVLHALRALFDRLPDAGFRAGRRCQHHCTD